MLALTVSLVVIAAGLVTALSYHFLGLVGRPEEVERLSQADFAATRAILTDLASPAHEHFARIDPQYTRDVVLFALDRIRQDVQVLIKRRRAFHLLPLFLLFRFYLGLFRLKTRFRANIEDVRRCVGFELFLLRRTQ